MYGEEGKEYRMGETPMKVNDEFMLASILAVVGILSAHIQGFDEQVAATASRIYDELRKPITENS
jgi:hypothetical protein